MNSMLSRIILTESQLSAIGAAAVESTFTEELVQRIIIVMSGVKANKILPFLGHLMMEGKLTILENLAETTLRTKKSKASLANALEAIRRANTGRISLIHGVWEVNNMLAALLAGKPVQIALAKNMKKPKSPSVSAEKAESIAKEISDAYGLLQDFWFNDLLNPMFKKRAKSRAKYAARRQSQ